MRWMRHRRTRRMVVVRGCGDPSASAARAGLALREAFGGRCDGIEMRVWEESVCDEATIALLLLPSLAGSPGTGVLPFG